LKGVVLGHKKARRFRPGLYGLRGDNHAGDLSPVAPAPEGQHLTGGDAERPARGETAPDVFGVSLPRVNAREDHVWDNLGPSLVRPILWFAIRDDIAVVVENGINGRDEVRNLVNGFKGFFISFHRDAT